MNPAADGSVIYLRTQRLEETLQRVTRAGGRVVLDKTALPDGLGVLTNSRPIPRLAPEMA
jgi:predicted enzyme related to lactoylglutathione lyase